MIAGAISYAISPLRVVGAVCFDDEDADRSVCGAPVLGHVDHVEDVLERLRIKGVFVDALVAPNLSDRNVAPAVRALLSGRRDGRPLVVLSELSEIKRFAHADDAFRASWRGHRTLRRKLLKASRTWPSARSAVLKRGFDIAASGALLLFLAPLLAVAAAAVRITMGAPVLFWQERPGRFGRVFRVYKLRSMREPDRRSGGRFSDGARLTHLGALLRRTRFDEIPQLFSVLRGEMSLVGPRPLLPEDMPDLAEARLLIRPGISGWAQVNGGHLLTPNEKIALDVWYAKRAGVLLDLWILLKSLRVVLSGDRRAEGAIAEAQREHRELVAQLQGTEPLMLPPQRQRRPERRTANDADVVPASHPAGTGVRAVV
jgi:lipopolysaccharide/colanic/teichoic acid biosynthesis glycosyltransferase